MDVKTVLCSCLRDMIMILDGTLSIRGMSFFLGG